MTDSRPAPAVSRRELRRRIRGLVLACGLLLFGGGPLLADEPSWDLRVLGKPPHWEVLRQPVSSSGEVKALFYTGLPFREAPTRVFAWLGRPKTKPGEKVPGIVLVHGGGGTAFEEWVRRWVSRGYAAIAMDTCGQLPVGRYNHWVRDPEGGSPGWGGMDQLAWPRHDQWTYQAVADVILAHSLLLSLPEVDPERTGVTGISWGGYLTCIVAGVDERFKFAVPVYGCGFYQDTVFAGTLAQLPADQRERWLQWWDASAYLAQVKIPLLWVDGSNDHFFPMPAVQLSYRRAPGPHTLCVRVRMRHSQEDGESPIEIRAFADSLVNAGTPLPTITGQGRDGAQVWATFRSVAKVIRAELNFTRDSGDGEKRKWETFPATLTKNRATAELPAGARTYFLNLYDERGCLVSTEYVDCSPAP